MCIWVWLCVWVCVCMLVRSCYLSLPQGSWGLNSGNQAWQQRSLPTEASYCHTLSHLKAILLSCSTWSAQFLLAHRLYYSTFCTHRGIPSIHGELLWHLYVMAIECPQTLLLERNLGESAHVTWLSRGGRSVLGKWTLYLGILRLAGYGRKQRKGCQESVLCPMSL